MDDHQPGEKLANPSDDALNNSSSDSVAEMSESGDCSEAADVDDSSTQATDESKEVVAQPNDDERENLNAVEVKQELGSEDVSTKVSVTHGLEDYNTLFVNLLLLSHSTEDYMANSTVDCF